MALFGDPFDGLLGLQRALEAFRTSGWLQSSTSGGGAYPPINIFRKDDDFILIAENVSERSNFPASRSRRWTLALSG
jgi:HSP20 family protein